MLKDDSIFNTSLCSRNQNLPFLDSGKLVKMVIIFLIAGCETENVS